MCWCVHRNIKAESQPWTDYLSLLLHHPEPPPLQNSPVPQKNPGSEEKEAIKSSYSFRHASYSTGHCLWGFQLLLHWPCGPREKLNNCLPVWDPFSSLPLFGSEEKRRVIYFDGFFSRNCQRFSQKQTMRKGQNKWQYFSNSLSQRPSLLMHPFLNLVFFQTQWKTTTNKNKKLFSHYI